MLKQEYIDIINNLFITEHKSCSETVFEAVLAIKGIEPDEKCRFMMRGFAGGLSSGCACGCITGGIAAISYLYYDGTEAKQDEVKALCKAFTDKVAEEFGTIRCTTLKVYWREEDVRCLKLVERVVEMLLEMLPEM